MRIYIKKTIHSGFEPLDAEDDHFAGGGQGKVYHIRTSGYIDSCLKKYTKDEDAKSSYDRIIYMIQNPPRNIVGSDSFRICWPTALAYDINKRFIGYIMLLAFQKSRDLKILEVYSPKPISQQAKYKEYPEWFGKFELDTEDGFKNRIKMMCNWAIALYHLHETGKYVVVDLKPENVMATATGKISIVDTDSFQISENGRVLFEGPVGTPEYLPPEISDIRRRHLPFTVSTDCFSAAVCFYSILTGVHPYAGMIKLPPFDKLESIEECIKNDLFAYGSRKQYLKFPTGLNLQKHFENLPPTIQALFKRAFGQDYIHRPTMEDWGKALHEVAFSQTRFVKNVVKPAADKTFSIKIFDVAFADTDYNYNIIRPYGTTLYTDVSYLVPKIKCEVLRTGPDVEIFYRLFTPSGRLQEAGFVKPGYTNSSIVRCNSKGMFDVVFRGWGNEQKNMFNESGTWRIEFYENDKCLYKSQVNIQEFSLIKKIYVPPVNPPSSGKKPTSSSTKTKGRRKSYGCIMTILIIVVGLIWAGYSFWYKDYMKDKDASLTYVIANSLILRSSKMADAQKNQIGTVPYGSELITYSKENGWAYVKFGGRKGYVSSDYLIGDSDFMLLTGVWGNDDAREVVSTTKCRLAVLDFLKSSKLNTGPEGWQIFAKPKKVKPNTISFPTLDDGYDYFTEFAFILKNNTTGKRLLAVYAFDDKESPVFRYSESAPEQGDIKSVSYNRWNKKFTVSYTGQEYNPIHSSTPTKKDTAKPSFEVLSVSFSNQNYNCDIITGYGQQLYSDMQYLTPRIFYSKQTDTKQTFSVQVKIFAPSNKLMVGSTSPTGCTFEQEVNLYNREGYITLLGWGNTNGKAYMAGEYRYEIWCDGKQLSSKIVNVKNKATASEPVSNKENVSDAAPEFPGGTSELIRFLSNNIKYPQMAQEFGTQGTVLVQFVIGVDGSISNVTVVKSVDIELDREAVRVVKSMPKWKPGIKDGRPVSVKHTVPISFKLQ